MAKSFHLTVARIGENLFDGEALSVSLPGSEGVFQVLADHEAEVATLVPGEVRVVDASGETHRFEIAQGGVAEVSGAQATILL
jgi:F-type H+-transporting ATPase subunit epsilon